MSENQGYLPINDEKGGVQRSWKAAIFIFLISSPLGLGIIGAVSLLLLSAIGVALGDLWKLFMHRMSG